MKQVKAAKTIGQGLMALEDGANLAGITDRGLPALQRLFGLTPAQIEALQKLAEDKGLR